MDQSQLTAVQAQATPDTTGLNQPPTSIGQTASPTPANPTELRNSQTAINDTCPQCHITVRSTDYFCFNCGKELHEAPKSISIISQLSVYIGSLILPPFGLIWGYKYLRQPGKTAKIVGTLAIVLTLISLVVTTIFTINLVNTVNEQVTEQVNGLMAL